MTTPKTPFRGDQPLHTPRSALLAIEAQAERCEAVDDDVMRECARVWREAAAILAQVQTPNSSLPPLDPDAPTREMLVSIKVPANWEGRLDHQWVVEREIAADRWGWTWAPFNGLTPAEIERLAILAEEQGEVIQVIGKALRHGWKPTDHTTGITYDNRVALETEVGQVVNAVKLMVDKGDVAEEQMVKAAEAKRAKWAPYLHHQS